MTGHTVNCYHGAVCEWLAVRCGWPHGTTGEPASIAERLDTARQSSTGVRGYSPARRPARRSRRRSEGESVGASAGCRYRKRTTGRLAGYRHIVREPGYRVDSKRSCSIERDADPNHTCNIGLDASPNHPWSIGLGATFKIARAVIGVTYSPSERAVSSSPSLVSSMSARLRSSRTMNSS